MAEKEATLILKLKDLASSGLNKVQSAYNNFRSSLLAVTAAVSAAVAVSYSAIKAYAQEEEAINKLNQALKNQGLEVDSNSKAIREFAAELQRTTTFEDGLIIETTALLTSFGLAGEELKKATVAAADLSKGLGIDLKSSAMLLGKAFVGETSTLSRYGIKIDENIPRTEKFALAMDQVNQRFGGQAQAALNTITGRIENMGNRLSDLKERIGAQLVPVFEFWIGQLDRAVKFVEKLTGAQAADLQGRALTIQALRDERDEIIEQNRLRSEAIGFNVALTEEQRKRLDLITESIMREKELMEAESQHADQIVQKSAGAKQRQSMADKELLDQQKKTNKERAANAETTLNFISTLASEKNKQLGAIGKAAGIAQATIDTYQAANKALASAPPPFNYALAAAVVAAGLSNVARISGVALAEGGVVMPRQGGTLATIGEAGKSEAVIPLDDEKAKDKLGDVFGGDVHIHIGTLIADEMGFNEFVGRIDEELYKRQLNRRSFV